MNDMSRQQLYWQLYRQLDRQLNRQLSWQLLNKLREEKV